MQAIYTGLKMHRTTFLDVSTFFCAVNKLRSETCINSYTDAVELGFVGAGSVLTALAAFAFVRINKRREALLQEQVEKGIRPSPGELRRMVDRAPDFRYML